jgi:phosphoribosylanthranilate isomerase
MTIEGRTRVKICGLTNLDDARCATLAGADFLGFILYPKSPRYVAPAQIATITEAIGVEFGPDAPLCVGVFVNEAPEQIRACLEAARLDLAQLHGDESPEMVRRLQPRAFKAVRPPDHRAAEAALASYREAFVDERSLPQLLVDAYHPEHYGGTGHQIDLGVARPLARQCRLLLAGGLAPETVEAAIREVRPWGVDVSSGVEKAKGIKDQARVRAFVETVKGPAFPRGEGE